MFAKFKSEKALLNSANFIINSKEGQYRHLVAAGKRYSFKDDGKFPKYFVFIENDYGMGGTMCEVDYNKYRQAVEQEIKETEKYLAELKKAL